MARQDRCLFDLHDIDGDPIPVDHDVVGLINTDDLGVYLLLDLVDDEDPLHLVVYVGRGHLNNSLKTHHQARDASAFGYSKFATEAAAFEEACRLFHRVGKSGNLNHETHPAAPEGFTFTKCSESACNSEAR
jgi:hypothetical protein